MMQPAVLGKALAQVTECEAGVPHPHMCCSRGGEDAYVVCGVGGLWLVFIQSRSHPYLGIF